MELLRRYWFRLRSAFRAAKSQWQADLQSGYLGDYYQTPFVISPLDELKSGSSAHGLYPNADGTYTGGQLANLLGVSHRFKYHMISPEGVVRYSDKPMDGYQVIDMDWITKDYWKKRS